MKMTPPKKEGDTKTEKDLQTKMTLGFCFCSCSYHIQLWFMSLELINEHWSNCLKKKESKWFDLIVELLFYLNHWQITMN